MTTSFLKSDGTPASDAVLRLYAERIRKDLPSYAKFWDKYVGEQPPHGESGNLDNKRKTLLNSEGTDTEEITANFTFLQQFSYKALWELAAAWRAHEHATASYAKCLPGADTFLAFVESMESFYMRIGACEDALYKCLYCLYKLSNKTNWKKLRNTTKVRNAVDKKLARVTGCVPALRLAEFHAKYIDNGRNFLVHYSRMPGCEKDGALFVIPFTNYDENKTWADNLKADWQSLCSPLDHMNDALSEMTLLFNATFSCISDDLQNRIKNGELKEPGFDMQARADTPTNSYPSAAAYSLPAAGLQITPTRRTDNAK